MKEWFTKRFSGTTYSIEGTVRQIKERCAQLREADLRQQCTALRAECTAGSCAADFNIRALSLGTEAVRRVHQGMIPYDVQLMASLHLALGNLVEMATGEGKTLVALLSAIRFAMEGRGVHVATVNPYLAQRDFEFALPVFQLLGLSLGLLPDQFDPVAKRAAYACDATYGVGTEFGFDYLRDQLLIRRSLSNPVPFHSVILKSIPQKPDLVQRSLAFAIIDEADSVLIDEARSPLIISEGDRRPSNTPNLYQQAQQVAGSLKSEVDFVIKPGERTTRLTDSGLKRTNQLLPLEILPQLRRPWHQYVECALHALHHVRRDVHYVVQGDEAVIVDEFTGRLCPERSWSEGIHQAVEALAGVTIHEENSSEVAITRPIYFGLYQTICGMTGTAREASREIRGSYGINTVILPLNRPCRRILLPDRLFATQAAKIEAVALDIAHRQKNRQPVLVGSRTIENSEAMAEKLRALGIEFQLLNAKQDAEEANIISGAGTPGTVTIATNMAGRGAHIPLHPDSEKVGGLHVIGLERHEAGRIDRQLIGRAARQGGPGSAQFYLSLEDDLFQRHAAKLYPRLTHSSASASGELPPHFSRYFLRAQRHAEIFDRDTRRQLAKYTATLNELKEAV